MSLPPGVVWVFLALSLGGCAALPTDYPRSRSEALPDSAFGRRLSEAAITQRLADRNDDFFWGPARLLYDLPAKRHVWYG